MSIDPIKYPLTGIGRYTYELAKALSKNNRIADLRYLRGIRLSCSLEEPKQNPNVVGGLARPFLKNRIAVCCYRLTVPQLKAQVVRKLKDYIYHGPNFYLPPFKGRCVVTIHDLSHLLWSECHPPERVRYMKKETEISLKRAAIVITDSEYVRREISRYYDWPLEKIYAVPLASAESFHPRLASEILPLLRHYQLSTGEYCFFSGTIEPRKNIDTLLDAYATLPVLVRKKWPLVIAGYKGWNSRKTHERIANLSREGWLRYFGYVPDDHLPILFAGARLFVFPSLYEGFGLPIIEAMASGVPVVCSNSSSLPEVAGDAAAMCEALDVETLSRLISIGLEDKQWRRTAIKKGLARAKLFNWNRCAQETINAYQAAMN